MSMTFDPKAFLKADEAMLAEIDKNLPPHIQKMDFYELRDYCDAWYKRINRPTWSSYHIIIAFIVGAACLALFLF